MKNTDLIWDLTDRHSDRFVELSDAVFDTPETLYTEFKSVAAHRAALAEQGFRITDNAGGMPTAVIGEAGTEGPVIAILGEYDALPGLSQYSGETEPRAITDGAHGHGCGHNMFGAGALLAATALKDWIEQNNIKARVRYYGCPAEEGGAAKTYMVRAGLFDDVDAAISWHPAPFLAVNQEPSLANARIDYTFHGVASHAAFEPDMGRSALDAVELMNVGVNYLREHMPDAARVHYAYMDAGGEAANVVQARAQVRQLIRHPDLPGLKELVARVDKIAEGAALMTETRMERKVFSGVSNMLPNRPLEEAMQAALEQLGPVPFDAEDRAFAAKIQATLPKGAVESNFAVLNYTPAPDQDISLCDFILPLDRGGEVRAGSTDVGDVSWAVPTVQCWGATWAIGTPFHTWQVVAHGKTPVAHKGMIHAAKLMATTARSLIENPDLLASAKAAHAAHLAKTPYECPIPKETQPPIVQPS
ncbi:MULTISPECIES: M20 family metallopeptidase [Rhodobacterales]|uniref:M20 family metallopeptidase n=1 Tax=Roseobacter sp. N2S TaxID=2663844 RepID=UPI0028677941|nr:MULTISPECIES: M20 family metallopeptidase [Rhodobacterales]MDR6267187.1 aminobenzoyl-glutamate utilization protein B [Roseobacter sp. N2S]